MNKKRKYDEYSEDAEDKHNSSKYSKCECEPWGDMIYRSGDKIHFTTGVSMYSIEKVIRLMETMIDEHTKKNGGEPLNITYIVDSPGGSVNAILKFVDFVTLAKKNNKLLTFTSIISGSAASAATIMSIVADNRYMTKNATAMIHELSSGNSGKYTELNSYIEHLKDLHESLVNIYCDKVKISRSEVEVLLRQEMWFTAAQYMDMGFVCKIF